MKIFKNTNLNGTWFSTSFYNNYNGDEIKRFVSCEFPKQIVLPNQDSGSLDIELVAIDKNTGKKYDVMLSCFRRNSGEAEPKLVFFEQRRELEDKVSEFKKDNNIDINPEELPFY